MNSLFGDFFKEFWRGLLGGVRDYLGVDLGRFLMENMRAATTVRLISLFIKFLAGGLQKNPCPPP